MEKKKNDAKKLENFKKEINRNDPDEELDLDNLLDVQGGQEDKASAGCGLGCYTGGVYQQDHTENATDTE